MPAQSSSTDRGRRPTSPSEDGAGRNLELKARDPAPEASLERCRDLGAVDCGSLWQRDTYFSSAEGRLKLREQRPGRCQLIHYRRADETAQRESSYRILELADPEPIRSFLGQSLGIRAVVTKSRRLFLWRSVRIHLDDVEGQGRFIELEAVAPAGSDLSAEDGLITQLRARLSITDADLVAESYGDRAVDPAPPVPAASGA
jgi:predicted adenylyl cyclase CyaB